MFSVELRIKENGLSATRQWPNLKTTSLELE